MLAMVGVEEGELAKGNLLQGSGCNVCNGTGYKGRLALYEVMQMNDELRQAVISGIPSDRIKKMAISCGMESLRTAGRKKIMDGVTTISEVIGTTVADEDLSASNIEA